MVSALLGSTVMAMSTWCRWAIGIALSSSACAARSRTAGSTASLSRSAVMTLTEPMISLVRVVMPRRLIS